MDLLNVAENQRNIPFGVEMEPFATEIFLADKAVVLEVRTIARVHPKILVANARPTIVTSHRLCVDVDKANKPI